MKTLLKTNKIKSFTVNVTIYINQLYVQMLGLTLLVAVGRLMEESSSEDSTGGSVVFSG